MSERTIPFDGVLPDEMRADKERAVIVAWLRAVTEDSNDVDVDMTWHEACHAVADKIEEGAHHAPE